MQSNLHRLSADEEECSALLGVEAAPSGRGANQSSWHEQFGGETLDLALPFLAPTAAARCRYERFPVEEKDRSAGVSV